jgi:hypothetical protein
VSLLTSLPQKSNDSFSDKLVIVSDDDDDDVI